MEMGQVSIRLIRILGISSNPEKSLTWKQASLLFPQYEIG